MTRNKAAEPEAFDFISFVMMLERSLPKRSKARTLIPALEEYVGELRAHARPAWSERNYQNGDGRSEAQRELLDIFLEIPQGPRRYRDDRVLVLARAGFGASRGAV